MKIKTFAQYREEAPVNATGAAVDMNPTGRKARLFNKVDRRSRWDTKKMYEKAKGCKK